MAISATTAGFTNTGHDITMTLVGPGGQAITPVNVMQFDSRQETQDITRVRLDNSVLVADLPKIWTGTVQFDRGDTEVDTAVASIEENWFGGQDYVLGSIALTISSTTGTGNAQVTFQDASFRLDDAGTWRGDDATTCRLSFRAARRQVG